MIFRWVNKKVHNFEIYTVINFKYSYNFQKFIQFILQCTSVRDHQIILSKSVSQNFCFYLRDKGFFKTVAKSNFFASI